MASPKYYGRLGDSVAVLQVLGFNVIRFIVCWTGVSAGVVAITGVLSVSLGGIQV